MKKTLHGCAVFYLTTLCLLMIFYSFFGGTGNDQNVEFILQSPSSTYWFGTDSLGRDLFLRTFLGGRVSLFIGIMCSTLSLVLGVFYGVFAGWNEGWVDRLLMRLCDVLTAIPSLILISVLVLSLNLLLPVDDVYIKSLLCLTLGIVATHWMSIARVTRGMVQEIRRKPFVESSVALGASPLRIIVHHILPQMIGTLMVMWALQVPSNMIYESFMSFIGLGIHPPHTSWGLLLKEGWKTLTTYPHLILFPSGMLFLTVWSVHILIDSARNRFRL